MDKKLQESDSKAQALTKQQSDYADKLDKTVTDFKASVSKAEELTKTQSECTSQLDKTVTATKTLVNDDLSELVLKHSKCADELNKSFTGMKTQQDAYATTLSETVTRFTDAQSQYVDAVKATVETAQGLTTQQTDCAALLKDTINDSKQLINNKVSTFVDLIKSHSATIGQATSSLNEWKETSKSFSQTLADMAKKCEDSNSNLGATVKETLAAAQGLKESSSTLSVQAGSLQQTRAELSTQTDAIKGIQSNLDTKLAELKTLLDARVPTLLSCTPEDVESTFRHLASSSRKRRAERLDEIPSESDPFNQSPGDPLQVDAPNSDLKRRRTRSEQGPVLNIPVSRTRPAYTSKLWDQVSVIVNRMSNVTPDIEDEDETSLDPLVVFLFLVPLLVGNQEAWDHFMEHGPRGRWICSESLSTMNYREVDAPDESNQQWVCPIHRAPSERESCFLIKLPEGEDGKRVIIGTLQSGESA